MPALEGSDGEGARANPVFESESEIDDEEEPNFSLQDKYVRWSPHMAGLCQEYVQREDILDTGSDQPIASTVASVAKLWEQDGVKLVHRAVRATKAGDRIACGVVV